MGKLDQGFYRGTLIAAGVSESKEKKTPFVFLTFEIHTKVTMGEDSPLDNTETRDVMMYYTENTEERVENDLKKLGFNGDFSNPQFNDDLYSEEGVKLYCELEEYKDKLQERWNLCSLGGKVKEPAPKSLIQKMNAKWKAHQGKFAEAPKAARPTGGTPPLADVNTDDGNEEIPF